MHSFLVNAMFVLAVFVQIAVYGATKIRDTWGAAGIMAAVVRFALCRYLSCAANLVLPCFRTSAGAGASQKNMDWRGGFVPDIEDDTGSISSGFG